MSIHSVSGATIGIFTDATARFHCHAYLELLGTADQIKIAELLVTDAITEIYDASSVPTAIMPLDICHKSMNIPFLKVVPLLEIDGTNLTRIEAESGTWLELDTSVPPVDGQAWERTVKIYGSKQQVKNAMEMIHAIVSEGPVLPANEEDFRIEEIGYNEGGEKQDFAAWEDESETYYENHGWENIREVDFEKGGSGEETAHKDSAGTKNEEVEGEKSVKEGEQKECAASGSGTQKNDEESEDKKSVNEEEQKECVESGSGTQKNVEGSEDKICFVNDEVVINDEFVIDDAMIGRMQLFFIALSLTNNIELEDDEEEDDDDEADVDDELDVDELDVVDDEPVLDDDVEDDDEDVDDDDEEDDEDKYTGLSELFSVSGDYVEEEEVLEENTYMVEVFRKLSCISFDIGSIHLIRRLRIYTRSLPTPEPLREDVDLVMLHRQMDEELDWIESGFWAELVYYIVQLAIFYKSIHEVQRMKRLRVRNLLKKASRTKNEEVEGKKSVKEGEQKECAASGSGTQKNDEESGSKKSVNEEEQVCVESGSGTQKNVEGSEDKKSVKEDEQKACVDTGSGAQKNVEGAASPDSNISNI